MTVRPFFIGRRSGVAADQGLSFHATIVQHYSPYRFDGPQRPASGQRCRPFRQGAAPPDGAHIVCRSSDHGRHGVTWIYLLDSQRTGNVTTAYGVEESPANFLISRDGTIVAVEQSGDALERSIVRTLGGLSGGHSRCSSTTIK